MDTEAIWLWLKSCLITQFLTITLVCWRLDLHPKDKSKHILFKITIKCARNLAGFAVSLCFLILQWFHFPTNNKNHFWIILGERKLQKLVFMWQDFVPFMSPFWSHIHMDYKMMIQGEMNWLDLRNRESEILSPCISDLDWRAFGPHGFILLLSFAYSEFTVQQFPQLIAWTSLNFFDSGSMNTSLQVPAALDLMLWYLVTMILKSFLWPLSFFVSSHPVSSLNCSNWCNRNLDQDMPLCSNIHPSAKGHAKLRWHRDQ